MRMIRGFTVAVLALAAFSASPGCVRDCSPRVTQAWLRLPPVSMPMLAGFGRIENSCATPITIVGVSSPAFADASLHETRTVEGVSRMRAIPELRIAPDAVAALKPGGLHLMLMQPHAPLKAGSRVVVEFALKDGDVLRGEFEVRAAGG